MIVREATEIDNDLNFNCHVTVMHSKTNRNH